MDPIYERQCQIYGLFVLLPFTMAEIPEKQVEQQLEPPQYPAPNIINVVPQGQSAATTGQEYRDQCKSLPSYRLELIF